MNDLNLIAKTLQGTEKYSYQKTVLNVVEDKIIYSASITEMNEYKGNQLYLIKDFQLNSYDPWIIRGKQN